MLLFWERGYEGTSMADLTQAMGLNPSSIYAAFGDKHALFQLVVKRYMEKRAQYAGKALEEPTLEKVVLMTEIRKQNQVALRQRLLKARKSGELSKEIDLDDYTRYLSTIIAGLSIQAANGSTKAELNRTAQMALRHLGY